jgi:hypothetical protein
MLLRINFVEGNAKPALSHVEGNAKKGLLTGENRENGVFKSSPLSPLTPVKIHFSTCPNLAAPSTLLRTCFAPTLGLSGKHVAKKPGRI